MNKPLADKIRPKTLDDVVGQRHILGKGRILRNIIESGEIPSMIFYGPSGTGKTTVANIAAEISNKPLYRLNATNASVSDIKAIVKESEGLLGTDGVLLYLDEIQNFNKKQQQSLLEYTENGKITLIASTTENPYFYVYNAILSRSTVFEFRPLTAADIEAALSRAMRIIADESDGAIAEDDGFLNMLAEKSGGDVRRALNSLELAVRYTPPQSDGVVHLTRDTAEQCTQKKVMQYDKMGDSHYDIFCLQPLRKPIRRLWRLMPRLRIFKTATRGIFRGSYKTSTVTERATCRKDRIISIRTAIRTIMSNSNTCPIRLKTESIINSATTRPNRRQGNIGRG